MAKITSIMRETEKAVLAYFIDENENISNRTHWFPRSALGIDGEIADWLFRKVSTEDLIEEENDRFGRTISPQIVSKLNSYSRKLTNLGFRESKKKKWLFYMFLNLDHPSGDDLTVFVDFRGSEVMPIYELTCALVYVSDLGEFRIEATENDTAFIIDAVTFAVSAILLRRLVIPQTIDEDMKGPLFSTTISNIKKGWSRIVSEKRLLRIVFAKSSWNIAGGGLAGVFLVVAGSDLDGFGMALGFGIFFFARGIGTGIGPILARKYLVNQDRWPVLVGLLVSVSGFFYFLVGWTLDQSLYLTVVLVILAHAASGANWVLSTILTQHWT